jgi:hypothetical protein
MNPLPHRAHRHRAERGFAVAAALLTLLVASTIGTTMAELGRLEAVLARQRKATAAALAAVDACAENAVASLPAGWEFTDVVVGSDGVAGTADDGVLSLASDCTGTAHAAPGAATPARVLLEVEATRGHGRRRLEAVVRRHAEPGVPSLLWIADGANVGRVTGALMLDGIDGAGAASPRSMLAAPADPEALDAWIAAQGATVVTTGGTGAPIWAVPPPLAAFVARAAAGGALAPGAGLTTAPPAVPHVTLSAGDLVVTSPRFGAGVLIVDGVLRVEAEFAFAGVVAATGGLRVEPSGVMSVQGVLWLGADSADTLAVDGSASVVASAGALAVADALLPLPRRATVASVRDF